MEPNLIPLGPDGGDWAPESCTLPTAERPLRTADLDALTDRASRAVAAAGGRP